MALGAAFTFVIMMFNVPIPGGTTGHAVGGVLVAVLLGPWPRWSRCPWPSRFRRCFLATGDHRPSAIASTWLSSCRSPDGGRTV